MSDDKRPTTLQEMTLTEEEEAEMSAMRAPKDKDDKIISSLETKAAMEPEEPNVVPSWAREFLPPTLRIPRGRQVAFLRFPSAWTQAPYLGVPSLWPESQPGKRDENDMPVVEMVERLSRVIMVWSISDAEEHLALKAARGERERTLAEQVKRMIRMVDGKIIDWTGNYARDNTLYSADRLWSELGAKCRQPFFNLYLRLHNLDQAEMANFFLNGLIVASAVAG